MNEDDPVNENNVKFTYFFHWTVKISWDGFNKDRKDYNLCCYLNQ